MRIGFIGAGKMAQALARGLINSAFCLNFGSNSIDWSKGAIQEGGIEEEGRLLGPYRTREHHRQFSEARH
ncbi:hypothetical protein PRIPAC_70834 [Pristionchus pacificus]|uniref:F420_oxidored domain-containing protein n=1 Tax=Pristionchus pacificus TaxID=54126 RepID=A0A2A6CF06_PRIPA|nr:hypothetical protein PRIPAC_70834 [Pristionchus pacificus]|eukprot:PDM76643.1 hypothetical protein PRIPAC_42038 [Pristionchus pacificus]